MASTVNRRTFLRGASLAGGGLMLGAESLLRAATLMQGSQASARRQVAIGGRRATVVDVHAHCVFPEVATLLEGTTLERDFPKSQVLGPARLEIMDRRGIDIQALSVNTYWWYAADRAMATAIVDAHDRGLAAWCKAHPDRFVGLTSPALQFPELAAEQLERGVKTLGLRGASIGGHVGGEVPSSPRFDPFWAKAEELGVTVFMHPGGAENVVQKGVLDVRGELGNIVGNPLETTVFLSRMIFDGTLDRFPRLKLSAAHAGGYLPSYMGRSEVACQVRAGANCANRKKPSDYLRSQIVVDAMVFSSEGLRHLVAEVGAGQVVYGSDIPFDWPDMIDVIVEASFLTDEEKRAILGGTLLGLLRLTP